MPRSARDAPPLRRPPPLSSELRRLIDVASADRERDTRNIVTRCRRLYPEYRALTGAGLAGLWQNVRYLVAGFYQFNLIEGRSPTLKELDVTIASAEARVAQGVSLGAMIGTYQLALPILWEHLIEVVEPHPAVLMELLRRVPVTFASINHVTTIVTETYLAARERLQRSRGEAKDEFLRLLVAPDAPLGTVAARARELGHDLDTLRVAVVFRRAAQNGSRASDLDTIAEIVATCESHRDAIAGRVDDAVLALLPRQAEQAVLASIEGKLGRAGWRIGVGTVAGDAAGLRRSALEARRAIEIGLLLRRSAVAHHYTELALHDLVDAGSARAHEFVSHTLGALAQPAGRRTYQETLRALAAHGFRLKPAAAALGIHPHTLAYRMKQMQRRHGLDFDDAQTRLRVALALLILDSVR